MIQPTPPTGPHKNLNSDQEREYLPARMINELVYCPRLFYLMHVEGQFEHNADTAEGEGVHRRVDADTDALELPQTDPQRSPPNTSDSTRKNQSKHVQPSLLDQADQEESDRESSDADQKQNQDGALDDIGDRFQSQASSEVASQQRERESASRQADQPIHARSVTLSSDTLGVIAKLDLVEATGEIATPVDYKRGRPRVDSNGAIGPWDPEAVQICLQAMVLRENGFQCQQGVLYYQKTRQRVTVPIDQQLIEKAENAVQLAREISELPRPPAPLINSPKCPRCSLSAICLPDETNRCRANDGGQSQPVQIRLPATPRDDLRPLYLNTQGVVVGKSSQVLQVKDRGKLVQQVRLREINQVNLFGNIQLTTQAMQTLVQMEIPVVLYSSNGFFYGMLHGTGLKNILLRREQFRFADDPARSLEIAKTLVHGKIRNQRVLLMRNHVDPPGETLRELKRLAQKSLRATSAQSLLGIEGTAARHYFEHFSGMIKPGDEPVDPCNALGEPPRYRFDFRNRNRRPPRDPINALLSLAYTLLSKDLTITSAAVGFDPFLGFYHLPRAGRPALALDLMEPFRPLLADSAVITAINNRMITPEHFLPAGKGVALTQSGRKAFFRAYENRMDQLVTHPLFDYRVSYRRLLEIQTRLLARVVSGEIREYPVFVTR